MFGVLPALSALLPKRISLDTMLSGSPGVEGSPARLEKMPRSLDHGTLNLLELLLRVIFCIKLSFGVVASDSPLEAVRSTDSCESAVEVAVMMDSASLDNREVGGEASPIDSVPSVSPRSLSLLLGASPALLLVLSLLPAFLASPRPNSVLKDGAAGFNLGVAARCDLGRVPIGACSDLYFDNGPGISSASRGVLPMERLVAEPRWTEGCREWSLDHGPWLVFH